MDAQLPKEFSELERFSAFILPTSIERNRKRISSPMRELNEFYDAVISRFGRIIEYFQQFSMEEMPQDTKRLLYLTLSFVEVAHAVERYGEPAVIDGIDPSRFEVLQEPKV
jgi:hypothetical protein